MQRRFLRRRSTLLLRFPIGRLFGTWRRSRLRRRPRCGRNAQTGIPTNADREVSCDTKRAGRAGPSRFGATNRRGKCQIGIGAFDSVQNLDGAGDGGCHGRESGWQGCRRTWRRGFCRNGGREAVVSIFEFQNGDNQGISGDYVLGYYTRNGRVDSAYRKIGGAMKGERRPRWIFALDTTPGRATTSMSIPVRT